MRLGPSVGFHRISPRTSANATHSQLSHPVGIVKFRTINMRHSHDTSSFCATLTVATVFAALLAFSPGTTYAQQTGLAESGDDQHADAATDATPAADDAGGTEEVAEAAPIQDGVAAFCQPFVSPPAARSMAQMALLSALLKSDSEAISEWDNRSRRSNDALHLALSEVTISNAIATKLLRTLRSSEGDSEQRNAMLATMLLTKPEQIETRLLTIRALSQELARLRGEPPRPMMIVAIAVFALNQTDAIGRIDPRHRIGLLEALIEIRDFAGVERATRGYEGHSLQSMLTPYRRATDFEERKVEVSETQAAALGHPGNTSLLMGMYHDEDGDYVWLTE